MSIKKYVPPKFSPPNDPVKLSLMLPILRAQRAYVSALINKHGGIMALSLKTGIDYSNYRSWANGTREMRLSQARKVESILDERQVQFADFIKQEWDARD